MPKSVLPILSSKFSSLTFKYFIHFEFILVYSVRKCSNFILLLLLFIFSFFFISWRLITLQYCSGFCHALT